MTAQSNVVLQASMRSSSCRRALKQRFWSVQRRRTSTMLLMSKSTAWHLNFLVRASLYPHDGVGINTRVAD
jgi:hypothetical protein